MLRVIDFSCKYAWIFTLVGKKGISITNTFQNILDESGGKPTKYGLIKAANVIINHCNHGHKIIM